MTKASDLRHKASYEALGVKRGCKHCKGKPDNPHGATTVKRASVTQMAGGRRTLVKGTCGNTGQPTTIFLGPNDDVD